MKKMPVCLLLMFISAISAAQDKQKMISNYFHALVGNDQFNGGVMVVEKDKIIYRQNFGYADDADKRIRINEDTRFALASISKTIVATAVLQLAEKKKLSVTDPVSSLLPWFPYPQVEVRHLLSHTSGLPAYDAYFTALKNAQPSRVFINADIPPVMQENKIPLLYEPGSSGNYDNINFIILALIIEKISGKTYQDFVQQQVLQPAGMTATVHSNISEQIDAKVPYQFAWPALQPHLYSAERVKAVHVPYIAEYWKAYNFSGFGNYVSTMQDLYKYAKAYSGTRLLGDEMKSLAFTPVKLNNGQNNPANFGLGWQIAKDSSLGKIVYHNGNSTGLSCVLLRNISKDQVIIVFDNIHMNNAQSTAFSVLDILNGRRVAAPKKSLAYSFGKMLVEKGEQAATAALHHLKKDTLRYYLSEDEMNLLGYDFLGGANNPNPFKFPEVKKHPEALVTFKLNTLLFPNSWNVYDSYGEALMITGAKKQAIEMYRKSIELNPHNQAGKKIVEQLQQEPTAF